MRHLQILTIILLSNLMLVGQNVDSLSLSFIKRAVEKYSKDDTVFYADGINKSFFGDNFKDALSHPYLKGFNVQSEKREAVKIPLSSKDQALLHSFVKNISKIVWPDNLLKNSVRISKDSIFAHIRSGRKQAFKSYYDSSGHPISDTGYLRHMLKMSTVYQFGQPIFLKKKSLVVFYYLRLCGGECGEDELAIYKLEKGQYEKWLLITGGVY